MTIHDVETILTASVADEARLSEDYHIGRTSALRFALELISEVGVTDPPTRARTTTATDGHCRSGDNAMKQLYGGAGCR